MTHRSDRSKEEARLLSLLREAGSADLYALAQAMEMGPRSVEKRLQRLCRDGLAEASDRGASFRCTREGEEVARAWQNRPPQGR